MALVSLGWTKEDEAFTRAVIFGAAGSAVWLTATSHALIRRVLCPRSRRASGRPTSCSGTSKGHPRSDGETRLETAG